MSTLKNHIPLGLRESIYWTMLLNPAVPLAAYFCVSTMLTLLAKQFSMQHPAYWIFGYLTVCLIHSSLHDGRLTASLRPVDFVFAAFVLVVLFSWAMTGYAGGNRVIAFILAGMTIPWMAARLLTPSQIRSFVSYTALFGSIVALGYWVAIPFMQDFDVIYERVTLFGEYAVYGVFGPTVGLLAVMSAVYLILPRAAQSERLNAAAWVMLPISFVVIVHMGGRGMFVSALLASLASCAFVRQSTWKRKVAVLSVVLVSSVVGLALVPETRMDSFSRLTGLAPDYPDRAVNDTSVARRPSLNVTELTGPSRAYRSALPGAQLVPDYPDRAVNNTITIRRECYREAVEIFLSKPVTGTGTGRYGLESHCFGESSALTTPHSTVLHILAELGVSGAVPFIVLNFMLLGIAWRVVRVQSGDPISGLACVVAAVWFYILIYDQISANYLTSFRYYLFSGLLISLHPLIKKDNIMVAQASVPSDCA